MSTQRTVRLPQPPVKDLATRAGSFQLLTERGGSPAVVSQPIQNFTQYTWILDAQTKPVTYQPVVPVNRKISMLIGTEFSWDLRAIDEANIDNPNITTNLSYYWRQDGSSIYELNRANGGVGSKDARLPKAASTPEVTGRYVCDISNQYETVSTEPFDIEVIDPQNHPKLYTNLILNGDGEGGTTGWETDSEIKVHPFLNSFTYNNNFGSLSGFTILGENEKTPIGDPPSDFFFSLAGHGSLFFPLHEKRKKADANYRRATFETNVKSKPQDGLNPNEQWLVGVLPQIVCNEDYQTGRFAGFFPGIAWLDAYNKNTGSNIVGLGSEFADSRTGRQFPINYFTRDKIGFEKSGARNKVSLSQTIDVSDVAAMIDGNVLGVQYLSSHFFAYIGGGLSGYNITLDILGTGPVTFPYYIAESEQYYDRFVGKDSTAFNSGVPKLSWGNLHVNELEGNLVDGMVKAAEDVIGGYAASDQLDRYYSSVYLDFDRTYKGEKENDYTNNSETTGIVPNFAFNLGSKVIPFKIPSSENENNPEESYSLRGNFKQDPQWGHVWEEPLSFSEKEKLNPAMAIRHKYRAKGKIRFSIEHTDGDNFGWDRWEADLIDHVGVRVQYRQWNSSQNKYNDWTTLAPDEAYTKTNEVYAKDPIGGDRYVTHDFDFHGTSSAAPAGSDLAHPTQYRCLITEDATPVGAYSWKNTNQVDGTSYTMRSYARVRFRSKYTDGPYWYDLPWTVQYNNNVFGTSGNDNEDKEADVPNYRHGGPTGTNIEKVSNKKDNLPPNSAVEFYRFNTFDRNATSVRKGNANGNSYVIDRSQNVANLTRREGYLISVRQGTNWPKGVFDAAAERCQNKTGTFGTYNTFTNNDLVAAAIRDFGSYLEGLSEEDRKNESNMWKGSDAEFPEMDLDTTTNRAWSRFITTHMGYHALWPKTGTPDTNRNIFFQGGPLDGRYPNGTNQQGGNKTLETEYKNYFIGIAKDLILDLTTNDPYMQSVTGNAGAIATQYKYPKLKMEVFLDPNECSWEAEYVKGGTEPLTPYFLREQSRGIGKRKIKLTPGSTIEITPIVDDSTTVKVEYLDETGALIKTAQVAGPNNRDLWAIKEKVYFPLTLLPLFEWVELPKPFEINHPIKVFGQTYTTTQALIPWFGLNADDYGETSPGLLSDNLNALTNKGTFARNEGQWFGIVEVRDRNARFLMNNYNLDGVAIPKGNNIKTPFQKRALPDYGAAAMFGVNSNEIIPAGTRAIRVAVEFNHEAKLGGKEGAFYDSEPEKSGWSDSSIYHYLFGNKHVSLTTAKDPADRPKSFRIYDYGNPRCGITKMKLLLVPNNLEINTKFTTYQVPPPEATVLGLQKELFTKNNPLNSDTSNQGLVYLPQIPKTLPLPPKVPTIFATSSIQAQANAGITATRTQALGTMRNI